MDLHNGSIQEDRGVSSPAVIPMEVAKMKKEKLTRIRLYPIVPVCLLALLALAMVPSSSVLGAGVLEYDPMVVTGRFFFVGDGNLKIRNAHNGMEISATLLTPEGRLNEEGFKKIDSVFGYPAEERGEHVNTRLVLLLDYFSDLLAPGKVVHLESGYRSPEYNEALRSKGRTVAKASLHMDGMAADFRLDGVYGKQLWGIIRNHECCGAGFYDSDTVHLDTARPRFWDTETAKVWTDDSSFNRRIFISTDYDRYRPGETVRLSFSSVSDFGFGIKHQATMVYDPEGEYAAAAAHITSPPPNRSHPECTKIPDWKSSRLLQMTIPFTLKEGRYRIRVDFCEKPAEQMPSHVVSNVIEVRSTAPK